MIATMSSRNNSTSPPTLDNPRGRDFDIAVSIVLVPTTIVVAMRLWGRFRYRAPLSPSTLEWGESMFWILMSDITVVISYILAVTLTILCYILVRWGEGLHAKQLSITQIHTVGMLFYVYQVLYKFLSGIAKIATLFLLLAISTRHMRGFNLFCKAFAVYIGLYCLATSVATVFQCGVNFDANWIKTKDQSKCFTLPPFWFTHAAINVSATAVMIFLPWWLFASISYRRKYAIAVIMSIFAAGETALGIVRLYGLYRSSHSHGDMSYGTVTGILVSQLEVDFACIAACVPTVLKMIEEFWSLLAIHIIRCPSLADSAYLSQEEYSGGSYSHGTISKQSAPIRLSDLRSVDREPRPTGPYTNFSKDDEDMSNASREYIIRGGGGPAGGINIQTEYSVTVEEGGTRNILDDGRDGSGKIACETNVISK